MTVAQTTWSQISLSTRMACGARNPIADGNSLIFQVTIKRGTRHKIKVTLDPSDTYTVQLIAIRKMVAKVEKEASDIYNDQLSEIIYDFCNR